MSAFEFVRHSDWSRSVSKRYSVEARFAKGRWLVEDPPTPIRDPVADSLRRDERTLLGFDFPIGIPAVYARAAGVSKFLDLLPKLGRGEWSAFFEPAAAAAAISLYRPFYPVRPGGTKQAHLLEALKVTTMDDLRRRCELRREDRRAAQVLFWTLGGNQVGRAALAGWSEVLIPHLSRIEIWPFAGQLESLAGGVVLCETYPTEFYGHFGLPRNKTPTDRLRASAQLLTTAAHLGVELHSDVVRTVRNGFVNDDAYDAFVGLLGMINVVTGNRAPSPPLSETERAVEGWIFGQA